MSSTHTSSHHHHHEPATLNHTFKVCIVINLLFVVVEFLSGWRASSVSLMSDAAHNLSDVVSLAVAWIAVIVGSRKAMLTASYANSALLLAAVAVILSESVGKLVHPQPVDEGMMIVVASIGIVVNLITALLLNRRDADVNVRGAYLHMLADTLVSVGVVVSGLVIRSTGWLRMDAVVGLVIGLVVLVMTIDYLGDVRRECQAPTADAHEKGEEPNAPKA